MRARMGRGTGEGESVYHSAWIEPGAQVRIE